MKTWWSSISWLTTVKRLISGLKLSTPKCLTFPRKSPVLGVSSWPLMSAMPRSPWTCSKSGILRVWSISRKCLWERVRTLCRPRSRSRSTQTWLIQKSSYATSHLIEHTTRLTRFWLAARGITQTRACSWMNRIFLGTRSLKVMGHLMFRASSIRKRTLVSHRVNSSSLASLKCLRATSSLIPVCHSSPLNSPATSTPSQSPDLHP